MSGIKTEKSKKFNPININNSYQPILNKNNKSITTRNVGLQPLGKIGVNRRVPAQSLQQQSQLEENGLASVTSDSNNSATTNNDDQKGQEQSLNLQPQPQPNSSKLDEPVALKHHLDSQPVQGQSGRDYQFTGLDRQLPPLQSTQAEKERSVPLPAGPLGAPIHSHPMPAISATNTGNHNSHRSTPPRLAAATKPILTDKELENLDDITRQTKWASGKITIDYDAKLNFSDDEDEPPQQSKEPVPLAQNSHNQQQDQHRLSDHGHRDNRRERTRSPLSHHQRQRNHQQLLEPQQGRTSPPSNQVSDRVKQQDRPRLHSSDQPQASPPQQLHHNNQSGLLQQAKQSQPPAVASPPAPVPAMVRTATPPTQKPLEQDQGTQPALNGSGAKEPKGAAHRKPMSSAQISQLRREGPPPRHNNYNSHHRNFHQNHYQHNNMNHPHHINHHGHHHQPPPRHNQQQRPLPTSRMNLPETSQANHASSGQLDKHQQQGPPVGLNVMPHAKVHQRLNAPTPAEQLAQSTAKLQINMNNNNNNMNNGGSNAQQGGNNNVNINNNLNNHHNPHHLPINDNGMNINSNHGAHHNNHGNHHNSHRAPTAPRFMREHHNQRNNSPPYTGDQQRHNQQPSRQTQIHHSPQRAGRLQQVQHPKQQHQPSNPSEIHSPPVAAQQNTPASNPKLPAPQKAQQQDPQQAHRPVAQSQSQQAQASPILTSQQQQQQQHQQQQPPPAPQSQQPQQQLKQQQHQQPKQQQAPASRQVQQHSRERDPPRHQQQPQLSQQQETELQSNKFRPVISRVFYRSDIKRISGSRQGDHK